MSDHHAVVPRERWLEARTQLLFKEKEFTRLRDQLAGSDASCRGRRSTRSMSSTVRPVSKPCPNSSTGRSQLIVYHFMFGPDWEAGCPHCSRWADNFNGVIVHLNQRDVTMVAVSRAPYAKLAAYEKRMGWTFKWVSSFGTDFNFDYHVSFTPEELASEKRFLQLHATGPGQFGTRGGQRVLQGRGGRRVPHLLDVRARHRLVERRL